MNNYGLVEKIFQGTGKTCYWRLKTKNITSNQMFKILINDQIQKLKRLSQLNKGDWENTNPKKIPYYFTDNNTSIYNLYPICTYANNWDSLNKKKRENYKAKLLLLLLFLRHLFHPFNFYYCPLCRGFVIKTNFCNNFTNSVRTQSDFIHLAFFVIK